MDKKILLTGWGYPPEIDGGLDIHVKHLFDQLQSSGLDVTLVLPSERAPDREDVIGVETGEGGMIHRARKMSSGVARIARDYDIVHTHDWFGAEAGFKSRKYSDCKWVSTMHSLVSGRSRGVASGEIVDLERIAATEADRTVTVSENLADEIEEEFGRKPEIIHNGFSEPSGTGKDVKKGLDIEGEMVFFVGRHAEQKGIEHLLYGFKKFLEDSNEATLVVGGDGYMRESLEKFSEMLGITDRVRFEGFIPSERLGDYYVSADLFVSPSINEPFGLTITEALESNTPVVATENGVSELTSGESIIEIDSHSDSIAAGIKRGLDLKPEVKEEGRTWEEMKDDVVELYGNL